MARSKSQKAKSSKKSKSGQSRKEAAPEMIRARLFLVTPPDVPAAELAVSFGKAAEAGDIACLLVTGNDRQVVQERVAALLPIAAAHNVAVVVENDPELAVTLGADGVQINADLQSYRAARAALPEDMIVGVMCGTSRHVAMELGEAGADYVAFDERMAPEAVHADFADADGFDDEPADDEDDVPFSLVAWWASVFEVPCVAFAPSGDDEARALAAHGVEFIRPLDDMWMSEQAAGATVARLNALFEEVLHHEKS